MLDAFLAVGSLLAYILIGTLYYRRMHIKRAIAHQRGEKAPGHHGHECQGSESEFKYHSCGSGDTCYVRPGLGCKGGPQYGECNCLGPFMAASLWWMVAPTLVVGGTLFLIHKLATPDVTAPRTRLEELEERNAELEKELGIL